MDDSLPCIWYETFMKNISPPRHVLKCQVIVLNSFCCTQKIPNNNNEIQSGQNIWSSIIAIHCHPCKKSFSNNSYVIRCVYVSTERTKTKRKQFFSCGVVTRFDCYVQQVNGYEASNEKFTLTLLYIWRVQKWEERIDVICMNAWSTCSTIIRLMLSTIWLNVLNKWFSFYWFPCLKMISLY
mgnify:CR=1 FL=1